MNTKSGAEQTLKPESLIQTQQTKNFVKFNVEMTDTFGGEANYCWVERKEIELEEKVIDGKIQSISNSRLIRAAKKALDISGVKHRIVMDCGDMIRLDLVGSCICVFISVDYN